MGGAVCGAPKGEHCTSECGDPTILDEAVKRRWCVECGRPLVAALDAYFGTYKDFAAYCKPCRTLLEKLYEGF